MQLFVGWHTWFERLLPESTFCPTSPCPAVTGDEDHFDVGHHWRAELPWDQREQRMRNVNKEMRQPVNTFYVSPILCLELMWKHKVCNHVTGRRHFIWRGTAAIAQYWEEFSPPFTPQHSSHSILFSTVSKPKQLAWLGAHGQPIIKLFGHVIVNLAFRSKRSLPGEETYLILNRKHISWR